MNNTRWSTRVMAFAGTSDSLARYRRSRAFHDDAVRIIEKQLMLLAECEDTVQSGAFARMTWRERADFMRDVTSRQRTLEVYRRLLAQWPNL